MFGLRTKVPIATTALKSTSASCPSFINYVEGREDLRISKTKKKKKKNKKQRKTKTKGFKAHSPRELGWWGVSCVHPE